MAGKQIDDAEILDLLRSDSDAAIELLFDKYYDFLCRSAFRICPDQNAVEDIVQDIFLELWRKRRRLKINISLKAYLRRAAVNRSLNYLRDRGPVPMEDPAWMQERLSADNYPEGKLDQEALSKRIDEAIDALPERCRLVFVLSRFEDLSYREIAELLEISPKTVENQIVKALSLLRDALKPYFLTAFWLLIAGF